MHCYDSFRCLFAGRDEESRFDFVFSTDEAEQALQISQVYKVSYSLVLIDLALPNSLDAVNKISDNFAQRTGAFEIACQPPTIICMAR